MPSVSRVSPARPAASSSGNPVLRQGARGSAVVRLQQRLRAHGFNISADGVFGPGTKNAVVAFQRRHGLAADGVVGPATWGKLGGGAAPAPARPAAPSGGGGIPTMGYRNGRPYRIHLKSIGGGKYLSAPAADAFNRMRAAAARQGVTLTAVSGFRSMAQQQALWRKYGPPRAARPGYSNHQSGVAVDIATNNSRNSAAYRWLARNGRAYGFYNTVSYEPWHWEYRR